MNSPWFVPDWPAPRRVRALCTTRQGGVSAGPYAGFNLAQHVGDAPGNVAANRALLRKQLPSEPLWLNQVHGIAVAEYRETSSPPTADAAVARGANQVLVIMSADCLPVLLADKEGSVAAVAHAGWRGLAGGVIERAVEAMHVPPGEVLAWLGPAIGPGAYEVGEDVRQAFVKVDAQSSAAFTSKSDGKYLADLYALARMRLDRLRVKAVYGGDACTYSEPGRYYSYRRDGATGRMASLIWITPD
ncbi:MAG TPA: peptidoglycan editing factor PgeF [Burkholderiales bacterium]|nr:peptidoglycan editing factor PgeF [Burkholderiales bacterium]